VIFEALPAPADSVFRPDRHQRLEEKPLFMARVVAPFNEVARSIESISHGAEVFMKEALYLLESGALVELDRQLEGGGVPVGGAVYMGAERLVDRDGFCIVAPVMLVRGLMKVHGSTYRNLRHPTFDLIGNWNTTEKRLMMEARMRRNK
jgi:hypothetical protein